DFRYEIGLTPNRADAASHLGVARDLAAYFRQPYTLDNVSAFQEGKETGVQVEVKALMAAPRYAGVTISGITVVESTDSLQEQLYVVAVREINNIVYITNYILLDLWQSLHAFDAAKIAGNKIIVRYADENEPLLTLDGV